MKFSRTARVRSSAYLLTVFSHRVNLDFIAVFCGKYAYRARIFRLFDRHFFHRDGYVRFYRLVYPIFNRFEFFGQKFSVEIKVETKSLGRYVRAFLIDIVVL